MTDQLMLGPYRVLDLTDERGEIAGMVLGDLGADVIQIEPPGGSPARSRGPLLTDGPEAERSLQFAAFNRNKRSIVLDLSQAADNDTLFALIRESDFVLDSFPGSVLDHHGIGFDALRNANSRIVYVQVSAFGVDGPAANWPASDLTIAALGGPVALQGVRERAPVRISVDQVWRHAGVEAAVAALVAHARMRVTGEAQCVDVSAQCAMTWTMLNAMDAAAIQGFDFERASAEAQTGQVRFPVMFECADGYVVAPPTRAMLPALVDWMTEEGLADDTWHTRDWSTYEGPVLSEYGERDLEAYTELCRRHPGTVLHDMGLALGVSFAPVNSVADVLSFEHLDVRDYWQETTLANGSRVRTPGVFAKASRTPLSVRRPAPQLDQHGDEIRREVGGKNASTKARNHIEPGAAPEALPFEGLKVADFSWVGVGPITARCLADHGATVVRVESELRPDVLRGGVPFKDAEPGWNRSQFFGDFNTSKLGLALNLKSDDALAIAKRLIAWADVYIESFRPGTVEGLGLGYEVATSLNPDIVMVSTCLMGQTGPSASMAGYGYHAGAMAGFYEVTGWDDLPPSGPWVAYTDTIAPRFLIATLLSALDYRRRTGRGQYLDAAQFEMSLHFLAPEILDYQVSEHLATRMGNHARDAAPHNVYPCAGDDQWCAIAIEHDDQWLALVKAMGEPAWANDPGLATCAGRLVQRDAIDRELSRWTETRDKTVVANALRAVGVPAGEVQRSSDLLRDPQYEHRGFYRYLDHGEMGNIPYAGHQFHIKGYDGGPRTAAPLIGEHSVEVLQTLLGMSDEEIADAVANGAIG
ncbi:MAG: CoA transferase [Gammaproteobacteria bacterium]|nr:CoA transferase [Gammaproteobacteria bacterium]